MVRLGETVQASLVKMVLSKISQLSVNISFVHVRTIYLASSFYIQNIYIPFLKLRDRAELITKSQTGGCKSLGRYSRFFC